MRQRLTLALAVALNGGFVALTVAAQTWVPSDAPSNYWSGVATSSDGLKMVACSLYEGVDNTTNLGAIYLSTNGGTNWSLATSAPSNNWNGVASSTNGTKLAAVYYSSYFYTSTNSGVTWQSNTVPFFGFAIASSADGNRLLVYGVDNNSQRSVFTSPDEGDSWTKAILPTNEAWYAVASSYNGSNLIVVANSDTAGTNPGVIYTSTNAGTSWKSNNIPGNYWNAVASSGSGSNLLAVAADGIVFTSADAGNNWTQRNGPFQSPGGGGAYLTGVAVSGDGTRMLAVANSGQIFSSYDSGVTWVDDNAPQLFWQFAAASLDGTHAVSLGPGQGIYIVQSPSALSIALAGKNVLLTWPWPSAGFGLQINTNLANGKTWANVTNVPLVTNLQNQVTLPHTNSAAFFRLTGP